MHKYELLAGAVAAGLFAVPALGANIILNNVDPPGVGFNDPTAAAPVGGNSGTTVGAQRLIAYQRALDLWGSVLKSNVTIVVQGSFRRLNCTATGGTLAQAGANQIFADFPNTPLAGHWFGVALANSIAKVDLAPGGLDPGPEAPPFADDIIANFNGDVGKPDCIAGPGWYYGLDSTPGPGQIDFLDTFMHEVAHGLGFQNFATEATGATPLGLPDVYMANTLDLDHGAFWNTFTAPEIVASAINNTRVVWGGARVSENAGFVLGDFEGIRLTGNVSKEIEFGTAAFGAAPGPNTFSGEIVLGTDDVAAPLGGSVTDGCEPITADVAGKIAMVDRGLCGFVVKAANAQAAGASALIIANTLGRPAFGMAGVDPTVTIATIGISNQDGDLIKAALPGVSAEFFTDPSRLAGTTDGYVRLYAPRVVEPGSSISHFDTTAAPNLLMEPFITDTLRGNANLDLTPSLMVDVGWKLESLKIGKCDTRVPNALPNGALLNVAVDACRTRFENRGLALACTVKTAVDAAKRGLLKPRDVAAITFCAATSH